MDIVEAAKQGCVKVVRLLLERGANVHARNDLALCWSAQNGHLEVLQWARSNGAPWNEQTCSSAAQNGHEEVLQWARSNGAPWDEQTCFRAASSGL